MEITIHITQVILYVAIVFALIRLIKGPRIMDRVMSMDGIAIAVLGILALESIRENSAYFIDIILVFSLFNFVGTVAFVYYLNKKYSVVDTVDDGEMSLKERRLTKGMGKRAIEELIKGEDVEP